jgi:hypothetical protein
LVRGRKKQPPLFRPEGRRCALCDVSCAC